MAKIFQRAVLILLMSFGVVQPASAAWHVADSEHFVIYADTSQKNIERYAEKLERFHSAVERMLDYKFPKPSPSNRVNIYVTGSERTIKRMVNNRYAAGFYNPRAAATVAVIPRLKSSSNEQILSGETVLLHEYAHHLMHHQSSLAWPLWLSEGFAEFFGSAKLSDDGTVGLGYPAHHRANELFYLKTVPIDLLLDSSGYREQKSERYDQFYGRAWLLYHYLTFEKKRNGQLLRYQRLLIDGTSEMDAAKQAFGDLEQLDKDIDSYLRKRKMRYIPLPASWTAVGPITVRRLDEGHAKLMDIQIEMKVGWTPEEATEALKEVRKAAANYPNDLGVLSILAETEYDAGNHDAAIAAADRAIGINSSHKNAYVQKGLALIDKAIDADDEEAAWTLVRKNAVALNHIENDHPLPLMWFFRSYVELGDEPTDLAIQGLERALDLAPFDDGLRLNVVTTLAQKSRFEEARKLIMPLANNPHNAGMRSLADLLLAAIDRQETDLGTVIRERPTSEEGDAQS